MNLLKKISLAMLAASFMSVPVWGVKAKPGLVEYPQPDGSVVEVQLVGDENFHYILSSDGFLLADTPEGLVYADIEADGQINITNIRAGEPEKRSVAAKSYLSRADRGTISERMEIRRKSVPRRGPGLFPGTHFPNRGQQKVLVILVEYSDHAMETPNPQDYFDRMCNEIGFSDYNATGSAKDYFREVSSGQFDPDFDIYGPVTLPQPRSYYGGNSWSGDDQNPEWMAIHACQALDDSVDFSQYDCDGDGKIDNVYIFYAGRGEASGGSSDTVWPHSWNVTAAQYTPYIFDGVRLDHYACSNEWDGYIPDGIGTLVHEFSHVMGLPDIYSTSYSGAFTPGTWDVMDGGSYNNNSRTPPLYNAFERYAMGWLEPMEIDGPVNATLPPISTNKAGIVKTNSQNEYFLLENRQQTGWDTYIPGHGMLIWHIDYDESVWQMNKVNDTPSHQYVDIEEADGSASEWSRGGDSFPGDENVTSYAVFKPWSSQPISLPLTEIAEDSRGNVTFKVSGGRDVMPAPIALEAAGVSSDGFTARWEADNFAHYLYVYTKDDKGTRSYLQGYEGLEISTGVYGYAVEGTKPLEQYYYTVASTDGWEISGESDEISVFTGQLPFDRRVVEVSAPYDIQHDSFVATWQALDEATSYFVSVYTKVPGEPEFEIFGFDDGAAALPEDWFSSTTASYANTAYSGEAIPALRLGRAADYISTGIYESGIIAFRFWHRGNAAAEGDNLTVRAYTSAEDDWIKVESIPVHTESGGYITTLELPETTIACKIEYERLSGSGAVAIDDIGVASELTLVNAYHPVYHNYEVGNATQARITGLDAETRYFYSVTATDGESTTIATTEQGLVTDKAPNGIDDTEEKYTIRLHDLVLSAYVRNGMNVRVYTPQGTLVGQGKADNGGRVLIELPSKGIYIVSIGDTHHKILAK